MRLLTGISIASLVVSTAALALVLWLVITQPWIVEEPVPVVATPTFTDDEVMVAVGAHIVRNEHDRSCAYYANTFDSDWEVSQDPSNPEKYRVKRSGPGSGEWTFYMGHVVTVGGDASLFGC